MFQFTHPGRGATALSSYFGYDLDVSIHAPREGCDLVVILNSPTIECFNSRTPGGVRPPKDYFTGVVPSVSIHAPREGCDWDLSRRIVSYQPGFQFTHPGRGATLIKPPYNVCVSSFNSRTPGGVRRLSAGTTGCRGGFNSRTPGGVRPFRKPVANEVLKFQFTHPGRGATPQPRHAKVMGYVSIHAPREGCDSRVPPTCQGLRGFNSRTPGGVRQLKAAPVLQHNEFQFTHPGRGATEGRRTIINSVNVSIHAPREGCDGQRRMLLTGVSTFQFTHPGRGAT